MNLLVALDAMLRERNISRAAEHVYLSQSAMSNALARLREYFNDELLVQVGRKFELTPRAERLQEAVHDVLMRIKATIAAEPEFDPALSDRVFKLLVSEFTTAIVMPKVLALAWQVSRSVAFELLAQTGDPDRLLARGEADLLLIPEQFLAADHPFEQLFEETYVCVVWQNNATIGDTITVDEYLAANHVGVQIGPDRLPSFERWFLQQFGRERKVQVTTPNFLAPAELVVGTDRVATMHSRAAHRASLSLPIRLVSLLPLEIPPLKIAMQWHKYHSGDLALMWLQELLRQAVAHIVTC